MSGPHEAWFTPLLTLSLLLVNAPPLGEHQEENHAISMGCWPWLGNHAVCYPH